MIEFKKGQLFENPECPEQSILIRSITGTGKTTTISWQRANRVAFESYVSYQTGREIEPDMIYEPYPFCGWDTSRAVHRRIMKYGLRLKEQPIA